MRSIFPDFRSSCSHFLPLLPADLVKAETGLEVEREEKEEEEEGVEEGVLVVGNTRG